jgi:hypothetical protein
MTGHIDLYRVLGLTQKATAAQIKTAYRKLAKEHHPDTGGDPEMFRLVTEAYETLSDEGRRADYDAAFVDGSVILDEVRAVIAKYVVMPSPEALDAVTLYAAATHAVGKLEFATRLVIKSPVKRCGKSRLLDILALLVAHPLMTANISAAALVYSINPDAPPTALLDEADATFGRGLRGDEKAEALRGILNAGYGRDRPYKRYNVSLRVVEDCPTFAMAVLAGIGDLPDTIEDRAVIIAMRRRDPGEQVSKFRLLRDKGPVAKVGNRLGLWVRAHAESIGGTVPEMPDALNDRAQDAWESLVSVAEAAGGEWPARARAAALVLGLESGDGQLPIQLLADISQVFADAGDPDRMWSADLVTGLRKLDERPWDDLNGKGPLDAVQLATYLKSFGVHSKQVRIGDLTRKGYERAALAEQWNRYTNRQGERNTGNAETPQVSESALNPCFASGETRKNAQPPDQGCFGVSDVSADQPERDQKPRRKRVRQCEHCLAYGPLTDGRCTDRAGCEKRQPTLEVNT